MKIKIKIFTIGILILVVNILGLFLVYQSVANSLDSNLENNLDEYQKFFGEWHKYHRFLKKIESFIFRYDGTFTHIKGWYLGENTTQNGTYEIQNDKLILKYENSNVQIYSYIFFEENEFTFVALFDTSCNLENNNELGLYTWIKTY